LLLDLFLLFLPLTFFLADSLSGRFGILAALFSEKCFSLSLGINL